MLGLSSPKIIKGFDSADLVNATKCPLCPSPLQACVPPEVVRLVKLPVTGVSWREHSLTKGNRPLVTGIGGATFHSYYLRTSSPIRAASLKDVPKQIGLLMVMSGCSPSLTMRVALCDKHNWGRSNDVSFLRPDQKRHCGIFLLLPWIMALGETNCHVVRIFKPSLEGLREGTEVLWPKPMSSHLGSRSPSSAQWSLRWL